MGLMIEGTYHAEDPGPDTVLDGAFRRAKSTIRHRITRDGSSGFPAEAGRYHLHVAWNCPWAHRTLLARVEKGLEEAIDVSFARPRRTADGWVFDPEGPFCDRLKGAAALHEVYAADADPYTGRVTVPLLWDRVRDRAVSNESADIVRMLNDAFDGPDLAPPDLLGEIEAWNARIYRDVNNGVYRAGFARTQEAYDVAVREVFAALDEIEAVLERQPWLCGTRFTEADLRLFPTLARFDVAYHYAFKCNIRRLTDYPNLWDYARRIHHRPGVAATVDFDIYKQGYFSPSELRNPLGIVPAGPRIDWSLGV
ncbi:glutathione S-transferase C-terminal domain-containing protein [Roseibacterium sp. SDUM158017]|uniref:glutathione S-transferase family protein n=1 Tax=Roseicyclus salinarum TaxID=3036773 RepID=UPI00241546DA|nr:glutathione S-transferase C-terminal domain-containing protein [Roseibacterium sp. SDUM158017]MDG4650568.1 glutathione S-transferase C-terminal domain-containing protein [Roseibacterium sp. SDUM158017]